MSTRRGARTGWAQLHFEHERFNAVKRDVFRQNTRCVNHHGLNAVRTGIRPDRRRAKLRELSGQESEQTSSTSATMQLDRVRGPASWTTKRFRASVATTAT